MQTFHFSKMWANLVLHFVCLLCSFHIESWLLTSAKRGRVSIQKCWHPEIDFWSVKLLLLFTRDRLVILKTRAHTFAYNYMLDHSFPHLLGQTKRNCFKLTHFSLIVRWGCVQVLMKKLEKNFLWRFFMIGMFLKKRICFVFLLVQAKWINKHQKARWPFTKSVRSSLRKQTEAIWFTPFFIVLLLLSNIVTFEYVQNQQGTTQICIAVNMTRRRAHTRIIGKKGQPVVTVFRWVLKLCLSKQIKRLIQIENVRFNDCSKCSGQHLNAKNELKSNSIVNSWR